MRQRFTALLSDNSCTLLAFSARPAGLHDVLMYERLMQPAQMIIPTRICPNTALRLQRPRTSTDNSNRCKHSREEPGSFYPPLFCHFNAPSAQNTALPICTVEVICLAWLPTKRCKCMQLFLGLQLQPYSAPINSCRVCIIHARRVANCPGTKAVWGLEHRGTMQALTCRRPTILQSATARWALRVLSVLSLRCGSR